MTRQFVRAVEGTKAKIADTRKTTPGLRMLEKYAVLLGGGVNHRSGLDDGVFVKTNHAALVGGVGRAVKTAREKVGHLHKIVVEVSNRNEVRDAIENGADSLAIDGLSPTETGEFIAQARELSPQITTQVSGPILLENVRAYADAGADVIQVAALTQSVRAMDISFQIQAG